MPQIKFPSLAEVPDGLREHAKTQEGTEEVIVNVIHAAAVDEFRDNNIKLSKERDELKAAHDALAAIVGDNPEEFVASLEDLKATKQRVEDGTLKESRGIEEAVQKRVEEMRKGFDERLSKEAQEKSAYRQKAEQAEQALLTSFVRSALKDACIAENSGVEPGAIDDITSVGLRIFKADANGKIEAFEGETKIYGADGVASMTPAEWLVKLKAEKPFFFKQSQGGGGGGDTTRKIHGVSQDKVKAMSAAERLDFANANAKD